MVIFGAEVEALSSYEVVFDACFQFCLGFLFDSLRDDLTDHNSGWLARLWIFLFFLIVVVLLVNMTLAIIFDVYSEVKSEQGSATPIWTQIWQMRHEGKKSRKKLKAFGPVLEQKRIEHEKKQKQRSSDMFAEYTEIELKTKVDDELLGFKFKGNEVTGVMEGSIAHRC